MRSRPGKSDAKSKSGAAIAVPDFYLPDFLLTGRRWRTAAIRRMNRLRALDTPPLWYSPKMIRKGLGRGG
jgi:hypothetical protein